MRGLMQDWPLLCHKIIDYAAVQHSSRPIISRSVEGPIVRTTYREIRERSLRVAQALERDGYGLSDRIATLAWNTGRHIECWYGIMGIGGIYHTLNPRLFPDQLSWIMNHAEDKVLFVDLTFVELIESISDSVKSLEKVIVLTDEANMPQESSLDLVSYETWLSSVDGDFVWKEVSEDTACGMCYTSGTTGNPKGVVYSHRSNVLHALMASLPDALGVTSRDIVMPVVPMFHANAWGITFSAPLCGCSLVNPGAKMDGESIYELLDSERVRFTAAVPTVWLMLLNYLEETKKGLPYLDRVVIGGSAPPRVMIQKFQDEYDVEVIHAWGMTEMSPLGTLGAMKPEYAGLTGDSRLDVQEKQGYAPFGVEMKVTDDSNKNVAWDGETFGRLRVRGPAIASSYYGGDGSEQFSPDGFFDTGDVAHIDEYGYMRITDRAKDVIKSGGEWISTIEIENIAMGYSGVLEAAVIGISHPKWDERPLLIIVPKPDTSLSRDDILNYLKPKVAKWWLPDDVVFVDEIPHTATGKIKKTALRDQFSDYEFPSSSTSISSPSSSIA